MSISQSSIVLGVTKLIRDETKGGPGMITGVHAIVYSKDVEGVRNLFQEVLGFPSVDAGDGWLIFGLPPTELASHPTEGANHHELLPHV
jgi:hypothetical protein